MTEAVDLIRKCFDAIKRGDMGFFISCVAEGCPWSGTLSPDVPYAGNFVGPQGAAKFFEAMGSSMEIVSQEFERFLGEGEHVVAIGTWTGKSRHTGRSFTSRLALYFQVRGGKIVRFVGHEDTGVTAAAFRS